MSFAERRAKWSEEFHKKDFTVSGQIVVPKQDYKGLPPFKGTWTSDLSLKIIAIDRVSQIFRKDRDDFLACRGKRHIKTVEEDLRKVPSTISVHQSIEKPNSEPPTKQLRLATAGNPPQDPIQSPNPVSTTTTPLERVGLTGIDPSRDPRLHGLSPRGDITKSTERLAMKRSAQKVPGNRPAGGDRASEEVRSLALESNTNPINIDPRQPLQRRNPSPQKRPFHTAPVITSPKSAIEAAAQKLAQGATPETQAAIKEIAPQIVRRVSNSSGQFLNQRTQAPPNTTCPEPFLPVVQGRGGPSGALIDKTRDPRRRPIPFLSASPSPPAETRVPERVEKPKSGGKEQEDGEIGTDDEGMPMDLGTSSPVRPLNRPPIVQQDWRASGQLVDASRDPRRRPRGM
jgi:hypothetical protein